jgi:hypothetical protein
MEVEPTSEDMMVLGVVSAIMVSFSSCLIFVLLWFKRRLTQGPNLRVP